MSTRILTTYLNDHLAGSVAALELLDHLIELHGGTEREQAFTALREEIDRDKEMLERVLEGVGGKVSRMRQAAGWLGEKVGQAKLRVDDPGDGELHTLEALEALGLGILGKLALWRGLAESADQLPQLRSFDLVRLQRRAIEQHEQVETQRLAVVRAALVL